METVWGDLMHDLYLGVAATAIACGLVELLEFKCVANADGAPFADARTTLRAMKADLIRWCKAEKGGVPLHLSLWRHWAGHRRQASQNYLRNSRLHM